MKEMGIDRTLLWPTLASAVEERLADDPDAAPKSSGTCRWTNKHRSWAAHSKRPWESGPTPPVSTHPFGVAVIDTMIGFPADPDQLYAVMRKALRDRQDTDSGRGTVRRSGRDAKTGHIR